MRLTCETESNDRRLPSLGNIGRKPGWSRSSLSIGHTGSGSVELVHILVCTAQNRAGNKYRVANNVRQAFVKFVAEGRATLSFERPPHDLLIRKADPLQLRSFLKIVFLNSSPATVPSTSCSSSSSSLCSSPSINWNANLGRLRPATTSQIRPPKAKMAIGDISSYQSARTSGFPSSLVSLRINRCALKKVDAIILQLRQLRDLDLSDNDLETLPDGLLLKLDGGAAATTSTRLRTLNLARNKLTDLVPTSSAPSSRTTANSSLHERGPVWTSSIIDLNLSDNRLESVPIRACDQLVNLRTVKLDHNRLTLLPDRIHMWAPHLRKLSASNNRLSHLPTGVVHLRLESIDVTGNAFHDCSTGASSLDVAVASAAAGVTTLLELAARTILRLKLATGSEEEPEEAGDSLPRHLAEYLSDDRMCACGVRFVRSAARPIIKRFDLNRIASTIVTDVDGGTCVPLLLRLCSSECSKRFAR